MPERRARDSGWAVVVPTVGRPSLTALLQSLTGQNSRPSELVVVDDRPPRTGRSHRGDPPLPALSVPAGVRVLPAGGHGPAAARNIGWQAVSARWVVFLDDDVLLTPDWSGALERDLDAADHADGAPVGGIQGQVVVPLPSGRRPTDGERGTAALQGARWITADMAYRRAALAQVDGFDERFPRAFREDADLALRVRQAGYRLVMGSRRITHPAHITDTWTSLRQQRGNADDALMRHLHGRHWRREAECPGGRFPWHALTVASALAAGLSALAGRRRLMVATATVWGVVTADFAARRIVAGPRTAPELRSMMLTSMAIPFAAVWHRGLGTWRCRAEPGWSRRTAVHRLPVRAVLFDRDGTLVHDVPYNSDPARVDPVEGAAAALQRLRDRGVAIGVITNQSGVGRGLLSMEQVEAVNAQLERRLGPIDTWQVCPHRPADDCDCRKPRPGLVMRAAAELGLSPREVVVVGDIDSDLAAAASAGSRAILVPTRATLAEETATAHALAWTLSQAVDMVLDGREWG